MKNDKVTIIIDTTGIREARVRIVAFGKEYAKEVASEKLRSQAVLPIIEELLTAAGITLSQVTDITALTGPGSFTGLRVGLAVANTLSVLLNVPINGKSTLATPVYS